MELSDVYQKFIDGLRFRKDPGMEVHGGNVECGKDVLLCVYWRGKRPFQVAGELIRYAEEMEEFPEGELVPEERLSAAVIRHPKYGFDMRIESKGDGIHCIYAGWIRFRKLTDNFGNDIREQMSGYKEGG